MKTKIKVNRSIVSFTSIIFLLLIYLYFTNLVETKALYPHSTEWFSFNLWGYSDNQSCIRIHPIYIGYYNDVSQIKGISTENMIELEIYLDRRCEFSEARIMVSATNLIFPITIKDNLNLSNVNRTDNNSFDINLIYNKTFERSFEEFTLYIPVDNNFFNYYRFVGGDGINFNLIDFEFETNIFSGYYAEEASFSLIDSVASKESPIYRGKVKRYEFNNTSNILLRFSPKSKPAFLFQKILDSLILGLIVVILYDLLKEITERRNEKKK